MNCLTEVPFGVSTIDCTFSTSVEKVRVFINPRLLIRNPPLPQRKRKRCLNNCEWMKGGDHREREASSSERRKYLKAVYRNVLADWDKSVRNKIISKRSIFYGTNTITVRREEPPCVKGFG